MDSSLSSVPPVCPNPRPETIGTMQPQAAANGASSRLTLSPTPPVLCLSTLGPGMSEKSKRSPELAMARVRSAVSASDSPRHMVAMRNADIW